MSGTKSPVDPLLLKASCVSETHAHKDEACARYWNICLTASHFNLSVSQFLTSKWFPLLPSVRLGDNWAYYLSRDVTALPQTPFDVESGSPLFSEDSQREFGPLVLLNAEALAAFYDINFDDVVEMFERAPFLLMGEHKLYNAQIMRVFSSTWFEARERAKQGTLANHFVN